jgi:hypothetical protein
VDQNNFINAFNFGNDAFGADNKATFTVVRGGIIGDYEAVSIDNLAASGAMVPGGAISENTVMIFINAAVLEASEIKSGAVLLVRNQRVRVTSVEDEGDNTITLQCTSVGVRMPAP